MFDPDYDLFVDIVEAGSISAAARVRNMSTAALSKRLVRLEARLSTRLINRTTRRLALTAAGQDLHDSLLPLRNTLKSTEERISGRHNLISGSLRITAPTSFGRMHVLHCVPQFLAAHPEVDLTLDLTDELVDLLDGSCDLAIRIGAKVGAGLVGQRLGTSHRVLCASPDYLGAFGAPSTLADLRHHRILATTAQLPWQLDGPQGTVLFSGKSYVRTNSSEVVRELAIGGCGIALRSLWDVSDALRNGCLRRVLPSYQGSNDVGIFAIHAPLPVKPARLQSFIDHLSACLSANEALH